MEFSSLDTFGEASKAKFSLLGAASPEDRLKPRVTDLIKDMGTAFKLKVESRTETHLSGNKGRLDMAIYVGGLMHRRSQCLETTSPYRPSPQVKMGVDNESAGRAACRRHAKKPNCSC